MAPAGGRSWKSAARRVGSGVRLAAALVALSGCATRAWVLTRAYNTLYAYEAFLKQHPRSRYAVDAWAQLDSLLFADGVSAGDFGVYERFFGRYTVGEMGGRHRERMEAIHFDRARAVGCRFAYEAFLRAYPEGDRAAVAAADTAALHQALAHLGEAARQGLPQATQLRAERLLGPSGRPEYAVVLALVPGRSPEDGNPGHYFATPAVLSRAINDRCLGVVRAVAGSGALPTGSGLVVRVRHGVGVESMGVTSSRGRAMTIYEVAAPAGVLESADLAGMADEAVVAQWEVREDLLPELRTGARGRLRP
ncbi:MAG: hypothetical protein ABIL09_26305 [Gemmatimonadota bacterium]